MSLNSPRRRILFVAIAVVTLAALAVLVTRRASTAKEVAIPVRRGPIVEAVYGIGTVTATRTYQLKLGVASTLLKLYVQEGDLVRQGAPLASLQGLPPFRAPFTGTITSLPYKIGETVFPQTPVATLTDLTDRYVVVSLEQQGALRVRKGQTAELTFESMREKVFRGTVRAVFSNEGQFLVHIDVPDLGETILPGMTADVAIEIARRDNALLAPVAGLTGGKLVVRSGRGRRIAVVKTGTVDGEWAEITEGDVQEGSQVLIRRK